MRSDTRPCIAIDRRSVRISSPALPLPMPSPAVGRATVSRGPDRRSCGASAISVAKDAAGAIVAEIDGLARRALLRGFREGEERAVAGGVFLEHDRVASDDKRARFRIGLQRRDIGGIVAPLGLAVEVVVRIAGAGGEFGEGHRWWLADPGADAKARTLGHRRDDASVRPAW